MTAIAGLLAAVLIWWLLKNFARADPKRIVRLAKMAGGAAAALATVLLLARGRFDMALLTGGVAAWLFGWSAPPSLWPWRPRAASRLGSPTVMLQLGRNGSLSGQVLAGEFAGRSLDQLGERELARLQATCLGGDLEGWRLLEAYLDRRFPGRREHAHGDPNFGRRADLQRGAMTEQEAHEILGLQPGAGPDEVRAAHRRLIKRLHPDQGGSTHLASRVNEAKDLLLNRHR